MNTINKFEIDMLNVGAADACLIHAFVTTENKNEKEYIVLVDAGNEGDGEMILNHIQKYYTKSSIDLVIITHCDSDHYGGMKYLIDKHTNTKYDFKIDKVWVHDPYKHVDVEDVKYIRNDSTLKERLNDAYKFSDGTNLLDSLRNAIIPMEEVFTGHKYEDLNISVLGPDKDYYKSLIPEFRVNLDFKEDQVDEEYSEDNNGMNNESEFYSKALEDAPDDGSAVNQSSIIFMFDTNDGKILFTGDAGKTALHRIIDNDKNGQYKNIMWMKVPHHGSKHNLDNQIISHFSPQVSNISTEKIGKYANRCTIHALKKVGNVYSTHKSSSLCYHSNTPNRQEYSPATPL